MLVVLLPSPVAGLLGQWWGRVQGKITANSWGKPSNMECRKRRGKRRVDEENEEKKREDVKEGIKLLEESTELICWLGCCMFCVLGTFHSVAPPLRCIVKFR